MFGKSLKSPNKVLEFLFEEKKADEKKKIFFHKEFFPIFLVWSGLVWSLESSAGLAWEVRGNLEISAYKQSNSQPTSHPNIEPSRFFCWTGMSDLNLEFGNESNAKARKFLDATV